MSLPTEEKLDRLKAFIRLQTQADAVEVLQFQPLSGGAIQENSGLAVRLTGGTLPGEHRFVVRSDAPSSLSASLSRAQEFAILQAAWQAGVRVPRPWWLCTDRSLLGGEFYIMQWADGSASGRRLTGSGLLTPQSRQALLFDLGCELGRLHQVAYSARQLSFLQAPAADAATRRIHDYRQALSAMPDAFPALELGLQALERHNPGSGSQVLCHGDFRTGNYMVDDQGHLTAILDWEFASWSDPYEDLAWLCARSWRFGHPEREAGGVGDKADFFAGYESVTGQRVDPLRVAYWEVMASVRWAVIALGQRQRHLSQREPSLELALTGRMLPEIQQDMMLHLRNFLSQAGERPADDAPATVPDLGRASATGADDLPDGADLLKTARETLLQQILPALASGQHYNARMIANAMAIARRELESGAAVVQRRSGLLRDFYHTPADEPAPTLGRLADDIRCGRLESRADLFRLIDALLALALSLSNPRRLPH